MATTASAVIAPELIGTWDIDGTHSNIEAIARYAMVANVRGHFDTFSGGITVGESLADSKVEVEIDAASINTNNEMRDNHLRSEDFMWVEQHPTITFVSTRVEPGDDEGQYRVWGDLTMRGVTREVNLDVSFEGYGRDAYGRERAGVEATTTLSRKDWGVNWNAALEAGGVLVGDKLKINLFISAVKRADA